MTAAETLAKELRIAVRFAAAAYRRSITANVQDGQRVRFAVDLPDMRVRVTLEPVESRSQSAGREPVTPGQ